MTPEDFKNLPGIKMLYKKHFDDYHFWLDYMPQMLSVNFPTVNPVRFSFEKNVKYIQKYLYGSGADIGCGSCPLLMPDCFHIDMSTQPLTFAQVTNFPNSKFFVDDATSLRYYTDEKSLDYIFSSHMLEDLPTFAEMVDCLYIWSKSLKHKGHVVLLLPDMQGGRHPRVEEGGNPSHRVNVGRLLFQEFIITDPKICNIYEIAQIDTIPHDESDTIDIVLQKVV